MTVGRRHPPTGERRSFARIDLDVPVAYVLIDGERRTVGRGAARIVDFGQGGVMLGSGGPLAAHLIKLLIPVAGDNDLSMTGKIVYSEKTGAGEFRTGVRFVEGPRKMRQVAGVLVRSRSLEKQAAGREQAPAGKPPTPSPGPGGVPASRPAGTKR